MNNELKKLRFALFGNEFQAHKSASISKILTYLEQREAEIYVDRPFFDFLVGDLRIAVNATRVFDDGDFEADFAVSMGGDGTFLKAASRVGAKQIPIIGVNMGRLGFLADVLPGEIEEALDELYRGEYALEKHAAIQIETEGATLKESPYALNDIALLKRDNASMISIRANVNGEYLVTYQADGLIVSTPTGSTAYSLSNGGPIMVPQAGILCLTPVAPHSLNIRPIVVPDDAEITLSVESRSHSFLVAIDGRSEKLNEEVKVKIRKAPYSIGIVKRQGKRYFSTLREKMMWGADQRQ
ncbi:MAG: NAD kinase [Prevotella sp.]|nr:NAD kinase [Prevotella sp.]